MLYQETVEPGTLALIKSLMEKDYLKDFTLVGGTALSLQLGHRKSIDIDLFTNKDFSPSGLIDNLRNDYEFKLDAMEKNTLRGSINEVKIDLITHKGDLVGPLIIEDNIKMASLKDIGAMKVRAIGGDGTRIKDFIDVYFLLKSYSFGDLILWYKIKYKLDNDFHAVKSLVYFNDIDLNDWPKMIREKDLTITMIKDTIIKARDEYFKNKQI
jgi:Nucleotidyl transferase AbiEii toxin, Type IV TA system